MVSVRTYKNPITGRFFLRAVKALVRVTLSDSFRIPINLIGKATHGRSRVYK